MLPLPLEWGSARGKASAAKSVWKGEKREPRCAVVAAVVGLATFQLETRGTEAAGGSGAAWL